MMPTHHTYQPGAPGGPANIFRQASPPATSTPASGPSMLRASHGQAAYQPQHFFNGGGINYSQQPQSRLYRPPPPAPNVLTNAHPPWTADPQQASAQLGPYPGNFPVAAAAGMSWQGAGGAAPMVHGMWPTAPGILTATQRPGPVPQQTGRSRCQEWTPIEVQWLLTLKGQKMTHPKIAEFLSDMFNVERTHHMVTKKLAALRKEAVKANVYEQSINNVLPRSIDILFEELTAEMGVPFVPSKERRENLLRYLKTFFSGVILDSQKAAAGAGAMGSHHEQAQF